MEFKDLEKVNKELHTTEISNKNYAEVNQRVLGFRKLYPNGAIETELISDQDGKCIIKATAKDGDYILATGYAYEKEGSSFINKTSYIENCETSAVGRALGFIGIGADVAIASYEEMATAKLNQEVKLASERQLALIRNRYQGENLSKLLKTNNIQKLEELPMETASSIISKLKGEK